MVLQDTKSKTVCQDIRELFGLRRGKLKQSEKQKKTANIDGLTWFAPLLGLEPRTY